MAKNNKNQQPDILQQILLGIFKLLWWLITLPFKGIGKKRKTGLPTYEKNYISQARIEIERLLKSENQIELKHAVMEADKLVDYALKAAGYEGETFADRLRNAEKAISPAHYDQIWQGHKVRNQLAHETGTIRESELRDAANKLINYLKSL